MEFIDAVRSRRMCRRFDPDRVVPRAQLETLLKLAIRAPSAGHTQGYRFLVLDDITTRSLFWSTTSTGPADPWRSGMQTATALVVVYTDRDAYLDRYAEPDKGWTDRDLARWPIPFWHVDAGMAAMTLLLGAVDAGLGACFFGVPGERRTALADAFGVSGDLAPVGVVALGYPDETARSRPMRRGRRSLPQTVAFAADGPVDAARWSATPAAQPD